MRHLTISTIVPLVHPDSTPVYLRSVDSYRIYDGTDELEIVRTVAPGLFPQEGRCWRIVYESPVGQGGARHGAGAVTPEGPMSLHNHHSSMNAAS